MARAGEEWKRRRDAARESLAFGVRVLRALGWVVQLTARQVAESSRGLGLLRRARVRTDPTRPRGDAR